MSVVEGFVDKVFNLTHVYFVKQNYQTTTEIISGTPSSEFK